jgi:hypothetical protein
MTVNVEALKNACTFGAMLIGNWLGCQSFEATATLFVRDNLAN